MKKIIYPITVFILLLSLFCLPVYSSEKIVKVATLDEYPPYCFPQKSKKGFNEIIPPGVDSANLQGYSWDVLRESFHAMGYTINLSIYPWKRAVYETSTGMDDIIFPMIKNPEREKTFSFSKESVDQVNFLIYVPLDSTIEWQGLDSLNGLTIGKIRGWNFGKKWDQATGFEKDDVTKIIQGFKMLDMGRIDGFAGYEINFDYALKNENWKTKYKKLPSFDASIEYVAGVKTNPGISIILDDFDLGKKKIIENGIFSDISRKWGVEEPPQNQNN
ncbi:ABC-type amino acid transport/signal transduction systems, periplasmic component/domain [Desulfamplus magnetovallimortis]|uniref:ABC-type amino acid transport/signal transduction systems, periplasmic component/domain n=1 Tax=Desulfamplus magnetovallimortis TaxID=1246637 RepID=A0A1W1HCX7_9BACT|nr:transporter substrate-binding domain-containing protein [Desulfamplus magnetovallimortis]SLM30320.1 ABC-type amino acid transport/signal transduction systems, periplasmic component/domain [Desulfamplus magnetovallimortis]